MVDALNGLAYRVQSHEPWVGVEGQLRYRLERVEQALHALVSEPGNPHSSAAKAQQILTDLMPAPRGA